ncbi:MAG: hypothetical protein MJ184_11895 [Treponema sp.]|uniref:hypothetical protein n=1 Tax=Treponema sp. TaxID=166 RepID=UPI00298D925D|nr:hypothetical protein [Treponema sp.]MCQ2602052.1 hypothetical protein [Treponema sp.]
MEFKGNFGKKIRTEENFIIIKQKSLLWGTYEKQVPYTRIKNVEIAKPFVGTSGYIRIVEYNDDRVFDQKKGDASLDTNSILFNGKKNLELANDLCEVIKAKIENLDSSCTPSETVFTKKKKGGNLKFIIFAIIAFMVIQCNISKTNKRKENLRESQIPTYERFGISETDFAELNTVFEKCGFSKITKVEKGDTLDDGTTSYYIEMEDVEPNKVISAGVTEGNTIFVYLTEDNKLSEILVNFNPVYKNGKVLNKIEAFTKLSIEEKSTCELICENTITKFLKSPSTARFCKYDEYRWRKEEGIIKAQGYVDSQNGFGAMVRTNYLLTYDCVKHKAISLNINGKTYKFE